MKKIVTLSIVTLLIIVGCSSVEKKNNSTLVFELDTVFGIKKDETIQSKFHYSTHMVQDEKLLVSKNELKHEFATELVTKELFLVDLRTQEHVLLKQFNNDIRVWDYVLIEEGFLYSTVEHKYYDHLYNQILEFKVIENIAGEERILDNGTILNPFTTPSFHFIDDVVYYGIECIKYVDNAPVSKLIDIVRYEKGNKKSIISIENTMTPTYYLNYDSEKLLKTELNKGDSSVGFVTHISGENKSNVYIIDKTGEYTKTAIEDIVNDLLIFENRVLYQLISLTEDEEVDSVEYFDLKTDDQIAVETIDDLVGRVVAMDRNMLGFIGGDFYPYLVNSNKRKLDVYKIDYDEFDPFDLPFIYSAGTDKLLIAQFTEEFPLQLSILKIKRISIDE